MPRKADKTPKKAKGAKRSAKKAVSDLDARRKAADLKGGRKAGGKDPLEYL